MKKVKNKEPFFIKYGIILFYLIIFSLIFYAAYYYYHEVTTFRLFEYNISMLKDSNYTIDIISHYEIKNSNDYIFKSSNEKVAKVNQNGIVHAKKGGNATIDIISKANNFKRTLNVAVEDDDAYIIEFKSDEIELKENNSITLKPIINNEKSYNVDLIWSSSNKKIVKVSKNGKCTALKSGIAYITVKIKDTKISSKVKIIVKSNKKEIVKDTTKTKKVKVDNEEEYEDGFNEVINNHIYVKNVELKASKTKLKVNEKLQLLYEVIPNNATNKEVTFSSNNEEVANVNSKGLVTAKNAGSVDITIKTNEGKFTRFVSLTIEENVTNVKSISLNKKETSLVVGGNEKLTYTINPDNATNKEVTWKISNANIATIDNNGNIKAISAGAATISVTTKDGKKTDDCVVTVKEKVIPVVGITLDKTSLELLAKESQNIKVTFTPENATNQTLKFESENPSIATVDSNGKITGVSAGTTSITVSANNKTAKCNVTVKEILVSEISLSTSNFQLNLGSTKKVNYSIKPDNATDKTITFSSSNSKVASVDNNGNIKGLSLGSTTITASNKKSGKKKSITVFVVPKDTMIDIRNSKYQVFQSDIGTIEGSSYKHMQNFAISNIGTTNQVIYLSTAQAGCINATTYPTLSEAQKGNLTRTIIYRITKTNIDNPSQRPRMYLESCGHGQAFDIEPNSDYIWTNHDSYISESSGYYWGHSYGIMRVKFKETAKNGAFTPLLTLRVKDTSGNEYKAAEPAIDKDNNLILMRSGKNILIYNYSEFQKGNQVLIYKSKISSALPNKYDDGSSLSYQGVTLKGGYFYVFRGSPEKDTYIEAFNLLGESMYVKHLNATSDFTITKHREPEGIHIYNNKIYIGTTHYKTETNKQIVFDIGYYAGK